MTKTAETEVLFQFYYSLNIPPYRYYQFKARGHSECSLCTQVLLNFAHLDAAQPKTDGPFISELNMSLGLVSLLAQS